ncbi:MAG: ATP-binding cassette domain-containing protein [Sphingobacteriales bacterium]|nr:MAG: ATP-binding cassette domain-containing protein [Sphingobacteriales bacterium]
MDLILQQLHSHYLASASRSSEIWGQERRFVPGDRLFVQAPSGTGKTSLIHLLYGLRNDASGAIFWDTTDWLKATAETKALLRAGPLSVVFQDLRLFGELTLWENLLIKKALGAPETDATIETWLNRLGLAHRRDTPAKLLSYGEQQRTAILRALIPDFQWLLLDEPFSHLDARNTEAALNLILEVAAQRNAGILYAELDANPIFPATQLFQL